MFTYSLKKKTLSMVIDGDIFRSWWGDSIDSQTIRNALAEHEGKFSEIALDITSNGGDVTVGMAIYTLIKDQVNRGMFASLVSLHQWDQSLPLPGPLWKSLPVRGS